MNLGTQTKDAIGSIFSYGFYEYRTSNEIDYRVATILNSYVQLVAVKTDNNEVTFMTPHYYSIHFEGHNIMTGAEVDKLVIK